MKLYLALTLFSLFASGYSSAVVKVLVDSPVCSNLGGELTHDGTHCSSGTIDPWSTDGDNYRTNVDITPPTQLLSYANRPLDTDAITGIAVIGSTTSNRIYKYEVELDDDVYAYDRCEVVNKDGELAKHVTYVEQKVPDTGERTTELQTFGGDGKRAKLDAAANKYTCSFYILNNEWIGALTIEVAFQRTNPGNANRLVKTEISLKYVPDASDPKSTSDQSGQLRDCIIQYHDACVQSTSKYFLKDGDTCDGTGEAKGDDSSAEKGNVNLQLSCMFLDTRYKVNDATGTSALKDVVGAVDLQVEGLQLESTYDRFYNGMVMSADNVQFTKVLFDDMTRGDGNLDHQVQANDPVATVDFSNKGVKDGYLSYTDVVTGTDFKKSAAVDKAGLTAEYSCSDTTNYTECYAQYTMVHMLQLKYNDLPQFSNSYIGCDACEPLIKITGDTEALDGLISTKIMISVADLPESDDIVDINGPKLVPADGGVQLLEPKSYKLDKLYEDITINSYKLMTTGDASPRSLDAPLLVAEKFTFTSKYGETNLTNPLLPLADQDCAGLTGLKVSDLGLESNSGDRSLLSRYKELFAACMIQVPDNSYAAPYLIQYRVGSEGASGDATIYQDDGRNFKIGSKRLGYVRPKDTIVSGITVVGTTIKLSVTKNNVNEISVSGVDQIDTAIEFAITAVGLTASHLVYGLDGNGDAKNKVDVETHATNGEPATWTLTSNDLCTGSININIADQTPGQEFNVFRTIIPCARMSAIAPIEDSVALKFEFDASLDLQHDVLTASADYEYMNNMTTKAFFGTCTDNNALYESNVQGCSANELVFADGLGDDIADGEFQLYAVDETDFTKTGTAQGSGMATLKACSLGTPADTATDYIRTFSLAMEYDRDLDANAAFSDTTRYCDSQMFTMTINRVKSATIVSATIENIALQRAVLVKDIGWEADSTCVPGNDNYYRLYVLLESVDGDNRPDAAGYTASWLTLVQDKDTTAKLQVFIANNGATVISTLNEIDVGTAKTSGIVLEPLQQGNHFQVQGKCVLVDDESDCSTSSDGNVNNGDSWSDYSQQFETDLVITGKYNFQDVATNVKITLKYSACPATDDSNDQTGQVLLALQSDCGDELRDGFDAKTDLQSLTQNDVSAGAEVWHLNGAVYTNTAAAEAAGVHFDCKKAYSDDFIKVQGSIYQLPGKNDCPSDNIDPKKLAFDPDCALTTPSNDWSVDSINITLVHKKSDGSKVEARLCYRESDGDCHMDATGISGETLDQFDGVNYNANGKPFRPYQLCCADTNAKDSPTDPYWTTRTKPSIGDSDPTLTNVPGTDFLTVFIPLNAFGQFPADTFEVKYETILKNSNMRRHLRATHKLRSSNSNVKSATIDGVQVLEPEVVSKSEQDAPAANATEEVVEESVPSHEHDSDEIRLKIGDAKGADAVWALVGIIIASIWVLLELVDAAGRLCFRSTSGPSLVRAVARASYGSNNNYNAVSGQDGEVSERFTNLRY